VSVRITQNFKSGVCLLRNKYFIENPGLFGYIASFASRYEALIESMRSLALELFLQRPRRGLFQFVLVSNYFVYIFSVRPDLANVSWNDGFSFHIFEGWGQCAKPEKGDFQPDFECR
jgi:hypothetical protein